VPVDEALHVLLAPGRFTGERDVSDFHGASQRHYMAAGPEPSLGKLP